MKRTVLAALIFILPLFIIYDGTVYREQPRKNNNKLLEAQAFLQVNLQPGDVVFHVSEGSWIGLATNLPGSIPQYVMPDCGVCIGGLTLQTQQALGIQFMPLNELDNIPGRVWIIYAKSSLSAPCDVEVMAPYIAGRTPSIILEDMVLSYIAIYLYEP